MNYNLMSLFPCRLTKPTGGLHRGKESRKKKLVHIDRAIKTGVRGGHYGKKRTLFSEALSSTDTKLER